MTHDEWKLSGPDDREPEMIDCETCLGTGVLRDDTGEVGCFDCDGDGVVEVEPFEPDAKEADDDWR